MRKNNGFTLIELIVIIAIISVISALAIPIYSSFQIEAQFNNTAAEIIQTLRHAQQRALAGEQDTAWGVSLSSSAYVLYANGDIGFDEEYTVPGTLQLSGLPAVEFQRLTGKTVQTGDITITANSIDKTKTINVNPEGRVQ